MNKGISPRCGSVRSACRGGSRRASPQLDSPAMMPATAPTVRPTASPRPTRPRETPIAWASSPVVMRCQAVTAMTLGAASLSDGRMPVAAAACHRARIATRLSQRGGAGRRRPRSAELGAGPTPVAGTAVPRREVELPEAGGAEPGRRGCGARAAVCVDGVCVGGKCVDGSGCGGRQGRGHGGLPSGQGRWKRPGGGRRARSVRVWTGPRRRQGGRARSGQPRQREVRTRPKSMCRRLAAAKVDGAATVACWLPMTHSFGTRDHRTRHDGARQDDLHASR